MPGKGRRFKKGDHANPDGCPKGAHNIGRPTEESKDWLRRMISSPGGRKRYIKILNDEEDAEEKVTEQGVCVPTRAKAQTYLMALELGLSYTVSKAESKHEVKTIDGIVAESIRTVQEIITNGDPKTP